MKRIIVADDDKIVVESVGNMLSVYYIVSTATTGSDVLKMCEDEVYDGLIIDVKFDTGISGLETVSILRQENVNIIIILFSAIPLPEEVIEQLDAINVLFRLKPLSPEMVREIIGK